MGAGALEIATKKLPEVRVLDVRQLTEPQKKKLIELAEDVWSKSTPMDWGIREEPDASLKELDAWLLERFGIDLSLSAIYSDVVTTVRSRIAVARDKEETIRTHQRVDVAAVANSIADIVRVLRDSKQFPEAFVESDASTIPFDFSSSKSLELDCTPILHEAVVEIKNGGSEKVLLHAQ